MTALPKREELSDSCRSGGESHVLIRFDEPMWRVGGGGRCLGMVERANATHLVLIWEHGVAVY